MKGSLPARTSDQKRPEIVYFADPMCSWCWGFSPVIHRVAEVFADQVTLRLVMGGLRPGTTTILEDPLKTEIRRHWEHVAETTGASFDFDFFDRDDFIYDTEPASRAVLTMAHCDPAVVLRYFSQLQACFYQNNIDITDAINPATIYIVFSRRVLVRDKAAKRRCSTPTASFANAVRGPARGGLSLASNKSGASGRHWPSVAVLANGMTITCALRLDPAPA